MARLGLVVATMTPEAVLVSAAIVLVVAIFGGVVILR